MDMESNESFINSVYEAAVKVRQKGRKINPAIVAAQGALESGYGRSGLATSHRNLFGIKAGKDWQGKVAEMPTSEWDGSRYYRTVARWRVYPSWEDCIDDYASIIERLNWYKDAAACPDDPQCYLNGLLKTASEPGWATDPEYASKVMRIAQTWGLLDREATRITPAEVVSDLVPEEPVRIKYLVLPLVPGPMGTTIGFPIRYLEVDGKRVEIDAISYIDNKLYIRSLPGE